MSAPEGRELGPYDTFQERIRWFYRNAPECLEARKHSFRRQFDVAFVLAMQEAIRAATPPAPEVTLMEDVATVLTGFDDGVFVRDTSRDHESGWATRFVPYLAALQRLAALRATWREG